MKKRQILAAVWMVALSSTALTQTARGQTASPANSAGPAKPAKSSVPANNTQAANVAQKMQENGGSLLRATMDSPPEPNGASLKEVSFFYVPAPEPHVLKKHDIVTVIVREESAFKSDGTTDVKRQNDIDAKLDAFIKLDLKNWAVQGLPSPATTPEIKGSAGRSFKGEASIDRSDSLTGRIAAEVLDVKPNGTLVLQGSKRIKTDDEEQQFILTGVCRATDVGADNTVLSTNLYDLALEKKHKGAVRDGTKRGWGVKLLDALNPF